MALNKLMTKLQGHRDIMSALFDAQSADRLASAMIFSGPSGIGKKMAALALAQSLVCEKEVLSGCGECGACQRVALGQSESVLSVSPDGAQIKIEQARDIIQFLTLQKLGRARVVIIDQAHLLNPQSGNSLLKSIEEPPAGTYFILITPMVASVLPTIRSRAQLVRFRPLGDAELRDALKEVLDEESQSKVDDWILRSAHGSVEQAERLLQAREEFEELEVVALSYLSSARMRLPSEEISRLKDLLKERQAQSHAASLIQGVFRDGLRLQMGLRPESVRAESQDVSATASSLSPRALNELTEAALAIEQDIRANVDRSLIFENFAIQFRRALETVR